MTVQSANTSPATIQTDRADAESVAVAIVEAVADATDGESVEQHITLYDHIDPEALERLAAHSEAKDGVAWEIEFALGEHTVTLTSDGEMTVS